MNNSQTKLAPIVEAQKHSGREIEIGEDVAWSVFSEVLAFDVTEPMTSIMTQADELLVNGKLKFRKVK